MDYILYTVHYTLGRQAKRSSGDAAPLGCLGRLVHGLLAATVRSPKTGAARVQGWCGFRAALVIAVSAGSAIPALGTAQSPVPGGTAASLGQAIAEAARSPLRPGGQAVGYDGTPLLIPIGGARLDVPPTSLAGDLAAPATDTIAPGVVGFTLIGSMVSYFATAYTLKDACGFESLHMAPGCWAAPLFPWGLVGAPAASAGYGGKAFRASGYGTLAGVAAFFITQWRRMMNAYGSSLVSGFLHFVVTQTFLR